MAPLTPKSPRKRALSVEEMLKPTQTVKVAVRIRPLVEGPDSPSSSSYRRNESPAKKRAWTLKSKGAMDTIVQKGASRKVDGRTQFHFDSVFDENTPTPLIYKRIARPMVETVVSGKHATIFAYGQTGSGKTFTIQGDGRRSGQAGIIQLVASDIFRFMRQGASSDRSFVVKVSYIEIYNERIRDLLSDDAGSTISHGTSYTSNSGTGQQRRRESHLEKVNVRATSSGEVVVNCIQNEVSSVDEVLTYLTVGNSQRMVAKTDMNKHSSRSHAIFRLTVESRPKDPSVTADDHEILRVSDFNLVDLAGSESVKMSNTSGIRLREGSKINQSLLSLSTVIHSLSLPEKKRPKHINYRDSKLTRMLQPHLSGNAEIAVICCISPNKEFIEESRTTLKFATRAKLISVKPKINEILDDTAKIKKLQNELSKARKMIEQLSKGANPSSDFLSNGGSGSSSFLGISDRTESDDFLGSSERSDPLVVSIRSAESGATSDYRFEDMVQSQNYVMPKERDENGAYKKYSMPLKDEESPLSSPDGQVDTFRLDAVPEDDARKTVLKYMKGKDYTDSSSDEEDDQYDPNSSNSNSDAGSSSGNLASDIDVDTASEPSMQLDRKESLSTKNITAKTEETTYDGPPASYRDVSFRIGSKISVPDTLATNSVQGEASFYGTAEHALDGRTNDISWDTMDLNTGRPEHVGQPLRALKSLNEENTPIPTQITIINAGLEGEVSLADRLEGAETQVSFLKAKLENSDDLVESVFKDLERARLCIHDLVHRNVKLASKLKQKRMEDIKEEFEEGEMVIEQYWLLKGSMYVGLFFFFTGGYEYFMASVIFLWLLLEANVA